MVGVDGSTVLALGDIAAPVFPRSAVKALQALPLITTGAADRFGLDDAALALACASHVGSSEHVRVAAGVLARAGLPPSALACGAHTPVHAATAHALRVAGEKPCDLHNNCSGKHAGMLATAVHLGEPVDGYWRPDHPVQKRVREAIEALAGVTLGDDVAGIDGCSVPNWAMPLRAMAGAFARFCGGETLPGPYAAAAARLMRACWNEPVMVGGEGRLDTRVMQALPGWVFLKTGAEGVYCAGMPGLGLGVAVKVDDGASRASEAVVMAVIARLVPEAARLEARSELRNWRGLETGRLDLAPELASALERLR